MAYDRDIRDDLEELYTAETGRFDIVNAPELGCIVATGQGDASSQGYQQAAEAVTAVARAVRQIVVERFGFTHVVPPLETLWAPGENGSGRSWMIAIPQPDWVDRDIVGEALVRTGLLGLWRAQLDRIHYEILAERGCAQTLHVGPIAGADGAFRLLVEEFLPARGLLPAGMRHEIYLTNPRTTNPEDMRTIIRQPVRGIRIPAPSEFPAESVSA